MPVLLTIGFLASCRTRFRVLSCIGRVVLGSKQQNNPMYLFVFGWRQGNWEGIKWNMCFIILRKVDIMIYIYFMLVHVQISWLSAYILSREVYSFRLFISKLCSLFHSQTHTMEMTIWALIYIYKWKYINPDNYYLKLKSCTINVWSIWIRKFDKKNSCFLTKSLYLNQAVSCMCDFFPWSFSDPNWSLVLMWFLLSIFRQLVIQGKKYESLMPKSISLFEY